MRIFHYSPAFICAMYQSRWVGGWMDGLYRWMNDDSFLKWYCFISHVSPVWSSVS